MSVEGKGARAVPVHKVLDSNVAIAIDEAGRERVLLGRGLAFGIKPSDTTDPAKVEKTVILDEGAEGERERRVLTDAPDPVVDAVTRAVDEAARMLGAPPRAAPGHRGARPHPVRPRATRSRAKEATPPWRRTSPATANATTRRPVQRACTRTTSSSSASA